MFKTTRQFFNNTFFIKWKQENLLFFYGISFFLGILFQITHYWVLLFLFPLFCFDERPKKNLFLMLLLFCLGHCHTHFFYTHPNKSTWGNGIFHISTLKESTLFNQGYLYKGKFLTFSDKDTTYKNIFCSIYLKKDRKKADCDYQLSGKLKLTLSGTYIFKPQKWQAIDKSYSFAEKRFQLKKQLDNYLQKVIEDKSVQNFLKAIISGDIDNQLMQFAFAKTGLSYLLVISGLHFNMIVMFLSILLSPLNYYVRTWLLLILVNLYFFFVGSSPPVERAYITISLILLGHILSRQYYSLNALGFALFYQTILNPLIVTDVGFQLSYLCCITIFLLYPTIVKGKTISKTCAQKFLIYLKKSFVFSLSVNIVLLPVILYYFHKFPLMAFIYNTIFPHFIIITIFLFLLGLLIYPIYAPLSLLINHLNNYYTYHLLNMIYFPPAPLMFYIRVQNITPIFILLFLIFIFFLAVFLKRKKENVTNYMSYF